MLTKFTESLLWGLAKGIGLLPFRWQYCISDSIYVIIYKVLKYRVKVTRRNLKNSFPLKSEKELRAIEVSYYKHLADIFLETMLLPSLSEQQIKARMRYINGEVIEQSAAQRSTIAAMAHFGSWELTSGYSLTSSYQVMAAYHPLTNKTMDGFFFKARSRYGSKPVAMSSVGKEAVLAKRRDESVILALIADQTPPRPLVRGWIDFLSQPTAFIYGTEKLALKYGMAIYYTDITKTRRGYYTAYFTPIYDGKEQVEEGEITRRYAKMLERSIEREPHLWLWSHKRWKNTPENTKIIKE